MTLPETTESRRQILHDMGATWREEVLRLLATRPLRFTEIKQSLVANHSGQAPLDGQVSKVLAVLRNRGYVKKSAGKNSPWSITDLGRQALTVIDRAIRPDEIVETTASSNDAVRTIRSHQWDDTVSRWADLGIDTTKAHPARRYDYLLGGKNNFAVDRQSAKDFEKAFPSVREAARENRDFLRRAVRHLVTQAGIRQFLDIGPGLPCAGNTHEVAQAVAPASRVVYADNDPMVLRHAQALLTGSREGATAYIGADLRDPDSILRSLDVTRTLDLSKPVGLVLVAVLHFVHGDGAIKIIVDRLLSALPPGSYLVASHVTLEFADETVKLNHRRLVKDGKTDVWPRSQHEFASLFDGLELVEPGVVPVSEWRRDLGLDVPSRARIGVLGAMGRKP